MTYCLCLRSEVSNVRRLGSHRQTIKDLFETCARSCKFRRHQWNVPLGTNNGNCLMFGRIQIQQLLKLGLRRLNRNTQILNSIGCVRPHAWIIIEQDSRCCSAGNRCRTNLCDFVGMECFVETLGLWNRTNRRRKIGNILRRQRHHKRMNFIHTQNTPLFKVSRRVIERQKVFCAVLPFFARNVTW